MLKLLTPLVPSAHHFERAHGASLTLKGERNEKEPHSVFAVDCSAGCGGSDALGLGVAGTEHKFVNYVYATDASAGQSLSKTMPASL
jgi:hypothetical protein